MKDLIDESLKGFNVAIFAFGMTGSGKTHTISGTSHMPGIVPRTVYHVFSDLRLKAQQSKDSIGTPIVLMHTHPLTHSLIYSLLAMVFLTYVELYNNTLYDLLSSDTTHFSAQTNGAMSHSSVNDNLGIKIHDHPTSGIQLSGSSTLRIPVSSAEEALTLIAKGNKLRATASTNLNDRSSRSHTVISLEIVSKTINDEDASSASKSDQSIRIGKINLIDLAGSENVKVSGAEGQTLTEAKEINKALTVLGDVLNSLSKYYMDQKISAPLPHIPYRNSKLTMLLKDSLGGNAKTMMIATVRWSPSFYSQSLTALRYAARARHIKCNPTLNVGTSDDQVDGQAIHKAMSEVARLRQQLETRTSEFNELKSRLVQLEQTKKDNLQDPLHSVDSQQSKDLLRLENDYREQIELLQKQSAVERQELTSHLRNMIHNQEGKLAAREKDYLNLEVQLEQQLASLHRAEYTNSDLTRRLKEKLVELQQVKDENNKLKRELNTALDRVAEAQLSVSDREQFIDALNKVSSSRLKHKKKNEELSSNISLLEGRVKELHSSNETANSEVIRLTNLINEQGKLMQGAVIKLRDLDDNRNVLLNKYEQLKKDYELVIAENNQLKDSRGMLTSNIDLLRSGVDVKSIEVDHKNTPVDSEMNTALPPPQLQSITEASTIDCRIKSLKEELEAAKDQIQKLELENQEKSTKILNERSVFLGNNNSLSAELAAMKDSNHTLFVENEALKQQVSTLMQHSSSLDNHADVNVSEGVQAETTALLCPQASSTDSDLSKGMKPQLTIDVQTSTDTIISPLNSTKRENIMLKDRISVLVENEKEIVSTLGLKLEELDYARNKLLQLSNKASSIKHEKLVDETIMTLEERVAENEVHITTLQKELSQNRIRTREIDLLLQQKTKQLKDAELLNVEYLRELQSVRQASTDTLGLAVNIVKKHIHEDKH